MLARADRFYGEEKNAERSAKYREALSRRRRQDWPQYGRAVESLLFALQRTRTRGVRRDRSRRLPEVAPYLLGRQRRRSGLDCALSLPERTRREPSLVAALAADCPEVVAARRPDIAVDDISSVYLTSSPSEREDAKDDEGQTNGAARSAPPYLEGEAARAKTPGERALSSIRTGFRRTWRSGEPERAIPMLEASERDLPEDYNPPARLAVAYKAMKSYDEALAASDRALARGYGPRKIGILQTRADIYAARETRPRRGRRWKQALADAEASRRASARRRRSRR